ncbi:Mur ligase family protein [SAR86 cluster bacterium]|nr:Mur ligase family protein [SAR86 cluster bacterium]
MNSDHLSDWLTYINSNRPNEGDFGLGRLEDIYSQVVQSPIARQTILVGGTNGKGSTIEFLKNFLLSAGYKIGSYTSPHLLEFNERIKINDKSVEDKKIIRSFEKIDKLKKRTRLTYFDYATLAAFDIFSEEELDFAILEIGIGGKYDPVNLINSDLSIITNIELDHEKWLGSSLEDIGDQKAAILKKGKLAILGSEEMPNSVMTKATKICSSHFQLNKDFFVHEDKTHWSYSFSEKDCNLDLLSNGSLNSDAAASALTAYNLLSNREVGFQSIIENTQLKGRCDIVNNFILDVSHNPASVKNLISFIKKNFKERKFKAIFASMSEKDSSSIIKEIAHLISEWNICFIDDKRFDIPSLINLTKSKVKADVNIADTVYSAVERGYYEGTPYIVFGSFITVSEAYRALDKIKLLNRENS